MANRLCSAPLAAQHWSPGKINTAGTLPAPSAADDGKFIKMGFAQKWALFQIRLTTAAQVQMHGSAGYGDTSQKRLVLHWMGEVAFHHHVPYEEAYRRLFCKWWGAVPSAMLAYLLLATTSISNKLTSGIAFAAGAHGRKFKDHHAQVRLWNLSEALFCT